MEDIEDRDNNSKKDEPSPQRKTSRWPRVERVLAIIGAVASLAAIIGVAIAGIEHTPAFERHHEEAMVSTLIPGDDYARMVQVIGSLPDLHKQLASGRQIYVFDRPWEYIQLLVDNSGTVLSVGVYAKTVSFKATLVDGFVLNGSPTADEAYQPLGVAGTCAASWYDYYQGYMLPAAGDFRSVVFGAMPATDIDDPAIPNLVCKIFSSNERCVRSYQDPPHLVTSGLDPHLLNCLKSVRAWEQIQSDVPSSLVIISAPNQPVIADMLNEDFYFGT